MLIERNLGDKEMKAPKSSSSGNNFEKHPEGQFPVICAQIIDLGTHYNERKEKDENKLRIMFISSKKISSGELEGKPFALFANFNFSMFQNSHLCKFVEGWRGKQFASQDKADEFDFNELVSRPAFVNVGHNGEFVNILTIMPLPEGLEAPNIPDDTEVFIFDASNPNEAILATMSEKTQEKIKSSKEYNAPRANDDVYVNSENPAPE